MNLFLNDLKVGDKVKITHEDGYEVNYTVGEVNDRFIVFSDLDHSWFKYTIIDKKEKTIAREKKLISKMHFTNLEFARVERR